MAACFLGRGGPTGRGEGFARERSWTSEFQNASRLESEALWACPSTVLRQQRVSRVERFFGQHTLGVVVSGVPCILMSADNGCRFSW